MSEFFTSASLRRLSGAGHFLPIEAPDAVASAIKEVLKGRGQPYQ